MTDNVSSFSPNRQDSLLHRGPKLPWKNDAEAEEYAADPKTFLMDRIDLVRDSIKYGRSRVVTATYVQPAFTVLPNGAKFWKADSTNEEDWWQGKTGLVVFMGSLAFVDEERIRFGGFAPKIGDWVKYDIHDAVRQITINHLHCREHIDMGIAAILDDPRLIY